MIIQELREKQFDRIAVIGGYWYIQDIDHVYNDLNRSIIKAFKAENGKIFGGLVNLSDEKIEALQKGQPVSIYEEYAGQKIYDFACEFIAPREDKELESLIKQWNLENSDLPPGKLMNKIFRRIEQIGGHNFIWA